MTKSVFAAMVRVYFPQNTDEEIERGRGNITVVLPKTVARSADVIDFYYRAIPPGFPGKLSRVRES